MKYRILGQFSVRDDQEREVPLPAGVRLAVLGVLLVNANRPVRTADLMRVAWGGSAVAEAQLHKAVSAIRHLLASDGIRGHVVTHPRLGYELRVEPDDLDKTLFERHILEAERAGSAGRNEDEADLLREALRLWSGPQVLPGTRADSFRQYIAILEQRRKRAAARLAELDLSAGRTEQVLDELLAIALDYPDDQRLCELGMIALHLTGRSVEAVEMYEGHAAAVERSTAARPDPALRRLAYAIGSGNEAAVTQHVRVVLTSAAGRRTIQALTPRQLPPDPGDLVGRADIIAEAQWLLTQVPDRKTSLVLSGPGGIGKTALAVHVAHRVADHYPDGQLYLDLLGTSLQPVNPSDSLAQLLRALQVPEVPGSRGERAALLRSLAAERRLLFVFDDVLDEAQVRDLIPGAPECGVLIISRRRLPGLDSARHLPALDPLDRRSATEVYRLVTKMAGVDISGEPEATARIVELCAGLPLALKVAGALRGRDRGQTGTLLADRLAGAVLPGLVYGDHSVERAIGASFDRLDESSQSLLLGLGLLSLPVFGVWTAAAVLGADAADAADTLATLAAAHLVEPARLDSRYTLHDLTREFALRRAEIRYPAREDRLAVQRRVYASMLTLASRAELGIGRHDLDPPVPPDPSAGLDRPPLDWLESERVNLRAAVEHTADLGLTECCWRLAVTARPFYAVRGYTEDWRVTSLTALRACREKGDTRGEEAVLAAMAGSPPVDDDVSRH
ncbi:BTAD domain-containing putative transcriptional regulator [Actinoplanes sp. NPDC049599]|uniref:AfsR/SARP family transcriptional regulator n=1 Tax=Actinoplanes sp. NPDC049599 TaxID=3363903 RepID=UPI0037B0BC3D